jgi:glyoxylase-like metal-dependent hydrolase (beta-lactamase superfamily II)/8-oxo-dGTP pyrophosphatase MutT (NUDIX family)
MKKLPEAVIVILSAQGKIFVIKRQNYLKAFPGYTTFPGGKVDREDYDRELKGLEEYKKTIPLHLLNALVRELKEETEFDLTKANIKSLKKSATATTPEFNPIRFETSFFVVELEEIVDIHALEDEAQSYGWFDPQEVLDQYNQGEILAVPPTIMACRGILEGWRGETVELKLGYDPETEVPMIETVYGVKQFLPLSNTFPPANRTNCFIIGESPKLIVDPSPKDSAEYQKLKNSISKERPEKIFLTHHHPDHHEFSTELARELKLPMVMSERCHYWLTKDHGQEYFEGIEIEYAKDGDCLSQYLGEEIVVYEQPGHADGQLGLAPKSLKWFIVSDLIQTVGTVLVGGRGADMALYFQSLQRVIDLKPAAIFPSHGIALGGVDKLEKTLNHRKMREEHIKNLLKKGKDIEEIFSEVYFDLKPELKKYAIATIESHIKKIKAEGTVS